MKMVNYDPVASHVHQVTSPHISGYGFEQTLPKRTTADNLRYAIAAVLILIAVTMKHWLPLFGA